MKSAQIVKFFDIFVMPTKDFEGFGYSMAEAMSQAVPVVTSFAGALPEIVNNNIDGFTISTNENERWMEVLEMLVKEKNLRYKIGKRGQLKILDSFSANQMSINYYNFFNNNNEKYN